MLISIVIFSLLTGGWILIQFQLSKRIGRITESDGDIWDARRLNSAGLGLGVLAMIAGLASPILGLIQAFGELDAVDASNRSSYLADEIAKVQSSGGYVALMGVAVLVSAIWIWAKWRKALAVDSEK